jgi:hypothetical protein
MKIWILIIKEMNDLIKTDINDINELDIYLNNMKEFEKLPKIILINVIFSIRNKIYENINNIIENVQKLKNVQPKSLADCFEFQDLEK